jgi:hypothetical protein
LTPGAANKKPSRPIFPAHFFMGRRGLNAVSSCKLSVTSLNHNP